MHFFEALVYLLVVVYVECLARFISPANLICFARSSVVSCLNNNSSTTSFPVGMCTGKLCLLETRPATLCLVPVCRGNAHLVSQHVFMRQCFAPQAVQRHMQLASRNIRNIRHALDEQARVLRMLCLARSDSLTKSCRAPLFPVLNICFSYLSWRRENYRLVERTECRK